ncbi:hypothetical protein, conserved [Babesia bigemina]|uniref:Acylphosphatase-like domain-containing protein n=1 Tax=Babesia bigemina TaxID=5866 RepID=A0A061D1G7_BABBI|nr:hypothetical protein, conserved [Babesia bigemina]CDR93962.1 hypothetical protein, conserved [Babesia bigemina]|eukprot:XP_012766148.1 hypothetical protein, conserved [Babesia bigemina]
MSTYFPKSLKNKAKSTLPVVRQSLLLPRLRPAKSLYDTANVHPVLSRGYPVFDTIFDTLNDKASGLRKYKPKEERPVVRTDYNAENMHEMNHRFRFKLAGTFNGEVPSPPPPPHVSAAKSFESELESYCNQLFLVGWIKCRRYFAIGHVGAAPVLRPIPQLQGNVIATSYMKRWMQISGAKSAHFNSAVFFDENYAIPKLDYQELTVVRDYRKPQKKAQHQRAVSAPTSVVKMTPQVEERRGVHGLLA